MPVPADTATSADKIWHNAYAHPGQWDQSFPELSLPAMFEATASRVPQASLIDFMGRKYSYAQTLRAINQVACGLTNLGIRRGDRIGIFLPNVPHYVAAYYGALRCGAVVVNFSPLYSDNELEAQVEDSGTRLLFTLSVPALLATSLRVLEKSGLERLVVGSVAGTPPIAKALIYQLIKRSEIAKLPNDGRVIRFSKLISNDGRAGQVDIDPKNDVALIQYTGGTTGTPKGAMLTHQNLSANARQVDLLDPEPDAEDRIMGVLPLFHVFANTCVLNRTIRRGGQIVMLPRFDAGQTLAAITRTKATSMPGVPTMYQALLDHTSIAKTDFSSLRVCISGGAPLPLEVKTRFENKTGARLVEGYGLTESSGVVSTNPYQGQNKTGTIGQPLPGTDVVLVDKDDPTRPARPGKAGEILVAGPQVMKGYWNRPDADAGVFVNGRLRTGDVGLIDADGYIKIVDRLKDMISVSGFKVFPSQVEAVLYRHPSVKEALVIGIPDARRGERPKAFVTLNSGVPITEHELMEWLNDIVGKHERVIAVEIRDSLPKTMIGKLSRKELLAEENLKASA